MTLTGDHVIENTNPLKYTSVSINKSWCEARRPSNSNLTETATNADAATIDHETSPLMMMRASAGIQGVIPLCRPVRLIPGMTLQVRSAITGTTYVGFNVYCASGRAHIFSGVAGSSGAVTNLTSISQRI